MIDRYNIDPNKVKVITNFVDTELFSPEPAPDTLITDRIFFLGRLTYAKNLEALITAAAETGWGLELVGAGELEKPLKQLAEELNADVNFVGKVPQVDLPELMRKYRYFILPSHYEGMPKALLEAMACGMCCLGTDASGIREVIKHNQNGILIPGTGAEEIAKEFRKLHEYDAEQLGRVARAFIMESHSMEGLAVKEYGLLSMLVSI